MSNRIVFSAPQHIHSWGLWCPYDPHVFEMGMTSGYRYWRECNIVGCVARQKAKDVTAINIIIENEKAPH